MPLYGTIEVVLASIEAVAGMVTVRAGVVIAEHGAVTVEAARFIVAAGGSVEDGEVVVGVDMLGGVLESVLGGVNGGVAGGVPLGCVGAGVPVAGARTAGESTLVEIGGASTLVSVAEL